MGESEPTTCEAAAAEWTGAQQRSWTLALVQSLLLLAPLGWLLARLVWLYYFFGLFFFLVAGLLVGATAFRTARGARPIPKGRLLRGVILVALCSTLIIIVWEYRHFSSTVGQLPKFAEARNAVVAEGRSPNVVQVAATEEFEKALASGYAPGGVVGYVLWSIRSGKMPLTVYSKTETIVTDHAGWVWPVRSAAAGALLAAGLWFSLESLRSKVPVTNVLRPGEEYSEEV